MSNHSDSQDVCCGGPAPEHVDACCAADHEAKNASKDGCGCSPSNSHAAESNSTSCCS